MRLFVCLLFSFQLFFSSCSKSKAKPVMQDSVSTVIAADTGYKIVYFLTASNEPVSVFLQRRTAQAKQITHVIYISSVNVDANAVIAPMSSNQQADWSALLAASQADGFKAMFCFNKSMNDMRPILQNDAQKKYLIQQLVTLQQTLGGAGLDFDIEYPASSDDTKLLGGFFMDLRAAMGNNVLLTADVGPKGFTTSPLGHLEGTVVNNYLNWVNTMPYGAGQLNSFATMQNVANEYVGKQVDVHKIVLGLPFFAKAFYMDNNGQRKPFNPCYQYLVNNIAADDITTDSIPYTTNGANPNYLLFNSPADIEKKAKYAKSYGGVMAWHWRCDTTNNHSLTDAILRGKND